MRLIYRVFGKRNNNKFDSKIEYVIFRFVYNGVYTEIEHLTLNDAGRYTCLAENPAGRAEIHFDIDVSGMFDWR